MKEYVSVSPQNTQDIAAEVLLQLPQSAVLALEGDLGSGKTCFTQGLAIALGVRQAVTSPTFTLIREYKGERPLYHIDLYRLTDPDEVIALGLDEYFESDGITAIEWAERAGDLLPEHTVRISFEVLPAVDHRLIVIT